jgi:D-threonate/D-erythronate kinase
MQCLVLADDLTGACDSAVQFRLRGVSALVYVDPATEPDPTAQVHAFNAESRALEPKAAEIRIREIAARTGNLRSLPHLVFKKIDSLLRGNPGQEIKAALDAFGCDFAVITPAFPDLGRTVYSGQLRVPDNLDWEPITVQELLCRQGLDDCLHTTPAALSQLLDKKPRYLSLDAESTRDLEIIVEAALQSERRTLWAGSGGLAAALASVLLPSGPQPLPPHKSRSPVLFCIGSIDPVTAGQLDMLVRERAGFFETLPLPWDMTSSSLRASLEERRSSIAALFLSGGDTAAHVCRALHVQRIQLEGEVVRGIPWGRLAGGPFDGLPVVTKSGAFGRPDALIRVADYFTCQ